MTMQEGARSRRSMLRFMAGGAALLPLLSAQARAGDAPVKIGMIGAGRMGGGLGTLWAKAGYQVMLSSRNPDNLKELVAGIGPNASAGTVEQAVAFGDVVVLLVPYGAMPEIAKTHGAAIAKKSLVLDVSNPMVPRDGDVGTKAREMGPALYLADLMPGAKVVRAFNAINFARLAEAANRPGELNGVPICGDDKGALDVASKMIRDIGYEPVVVGGLAMGKHLIPGTPLAGLRTGAEIRQIIPTLQ